MQRSPLHIAGLKIWLRNYLELLLDLPWDEFSKDKFDLKRAHAAMAKNNFYGTQFHPEKSGATGAQLLQNFLSL